MARKRKTTTSRKGKAKAGGTAGRRKTVKRAAARKPARKPARKTAGKPARKPARKVARRRRKAKSENLGQRIEHATAAVLDTLTDAERLHDRLADKGVQEPE